MNHLYYIDLFLFVKQKTKKIKKFFEKRTARISSSHLDSDLLQKKKRSFDRLKKREVVETMKVNYHGWHCLKYKKLQKQLFNSVTAAF